MRPLVRHSWRVSHAEATAIQRRLRERLRLEPLRTRPGLIAAADVAYSRRSHRMYAAVVMVSFPALEVVETVHAVRAARFPYIPGLFSFRELPPLLAAFARLERRPDVLLFDGQGLAHPRGLGLACHAGVLFGVPSVGCAKSRLVGTHDPVGGDRGAWTPLAFEGRTVGAALRTRTGVKPVYVSPGHLVDLASSIRLVLDTTERFRLPEPIRLAHAATGDLMRRLDPRAPVPRTRGYPDFRAKTTWPRAAERDPGARRRGR